MKYSIAFVLLFLLNLNNSAFGQDSIMHPRSWELVLNLSSNYYSIVTIRPSAAHTISISKIPQIDVGFRRNVHLGNRFMLSAGASYRYIPFTVKYGYSSETSPNLLDPNDYKYNKYSASIEFPLLIKYHLTTADNSRLISLFMGFTYSLLGTSKGWDNRGHRFYDPYREEDATFYLYQEFYPYNYYKDMLWSTVMPDYAFLLGGDLYLNSHFKLSAHISYYPKDIVVLSYSSGLNCSCYDSPERAEVSRSKLVFGLGFSYLFNFRKSE